MFNCLETFCIKALIYLKIGKYGFNTSDGGKLAGDVQKHKSLYGKVVSSCKEKNCVVDALQNIDYFAAYLLQTIPWYFLGLFYFLVLISLSLISDFPVDYPFFVAWILTSTVRRRLLYNGRNCSAWSLRHLKTQKHSVNIALYSFGFSYENFNRLFPDVVFLIQIPNRIQCACVWIKRCYANTLCCFICLAFDSYSS